MSSRPPKTGRTTRPASGSSTKTRKRTLCPRLRASWSSTPRGWPSTSPTTKKGRLIPSGLRRARRMTSVSPAKEPPCSRCCCMSNHGRWRTHAQGDDITWTRETPTCKVLGPDGYRYEPVWINPKDAAKRGIKDGDIVKVFNERGVVLCGARVWERMMPGVVYVDHGARHDPIIDNVDRGGAINTIAPNGITSKNAVRPGHQRLPGRCPESHRKRLSGMARERPRAFDECF